MKVLHYVDENRLSWDRTWIRLIKELTLHGVDNYVVCRSGGTLTGHLRDEKIEFCVCDVPIAWLPWTALRLGRIMNEVKPDLVHTRLSSAARIGGWWGKRKGLPVVSTVDKYAKGYYYKNASFLVPCSYSVRANILGLGFKDEEMQVIHNPVDSYMYRRDQKVRLQKRNELGVAENEMLMLAAGWFNEGKGFEDAVRAYAEFMRNEPILASKTSLHIVGDGAERDRYVKLIAQLGVGERVTLHPFADDIRPWLWAADLFIQPSLRPEGFSLILLEAMAAGTPAIATNIGGSLDIIENGENGWLCEPQNYENLASVIASVVRSPRALYNVAGKAVLSAEKFNVEKVASETIAMYRRVLDVKRRMSVKEEDVNCQ